MDAMELRLGNYIRVRNRKPLDLFFKVKAIHFDGIFYEGLDGEGSEPIERIEPIPITEEWLINLGFEELKDFYDDVDKAFYLSDNIYVTVTDGHFNFGLGIEEWSKPIEFVHTLQNMVFYFKDIELTIKETAK